MLSYALLILNKYKFFSFLPTIAKFSAPPVFDETANRFHRVANGTKIYKLICPVKVNPGEELLIEWSKDDKEVSVFFFLFTY